MPTLAPSLKARGTEKNTFAGKWAGRRICFVSNCPRMGGAERVLLETIDVLQGRGIECNVLIPAEGQFAQELSRRGIVHKVVRSTSLTMREKPSLWERWKAAIRFILAIISATKQIAIWKCDIVFSNTVNVGHGAIASRILAKPHVWHLHEFGREDHDFQFYFGERLSCKIIGSLSSVCIVVSKALAVKYAEYISPTKLAVVYPSMHLELEHLPMSADSSKAATALRHSAFRCIIVGGVFEGKRQEDAVRAFGLLKKQDVNAELIIVGGSENLGYRAKLDRMICELGLQGSVTFTGEVRDARSQIETSDVLIVCSRSEAFGRVTIEAMLAGKPVIGASGGATPELVQDGFNGLIYEVANSDALADKIFHLYQHPDMARRLGDNGKRWASTLFNKRRYSEELNSTLDRIAETTNKNL